MVSAVQKALAETDSSLTEQDVVELIREARAAVHGAAPMPAGDVEYLLAHGGLSDTSKALLVNPNGEELKRRRQRVAMSSRLCALEVSMSVKEAAQALGKDPSTVYRSYERLAGFSVGGRRRVPCWAIHDGQELRRLSEIPTFIWRELHPLTVADIMSTPQESLEGNSPVDWLSTGGDVTPVVTLLEGHLRW